jgi:hypothetical protein
MDSCEEFTHPWFCDIHELWLKCTEDCPGCFAEALRTEMRLKEEWVKEHPGEPPFKD